MKITFVAQSIRHRAFSHFLIVLNETDERTKCHERFDVKSTLCKENLITLYPITLRYFLDGFVNWTDCQVGCSIFMIKKMEDRDS